LLSLVEPFDDRYAGICWDVAHDWENDLSHGRAITEPDASFLARVAHVHIHDSAPDGSVHYPLGDGGVPWRGHLATLASAGYAGSVIMEIRYRYALAVGEPWHVLRDSYRAAESELAALARSGREVEVQVQNRGMDVH
jgi:sugar phosphate isomerase/epimerase